MKIPLLPAIALALFPLSIGCESSGHQQSDAAGTRMDQLRTAAQAAKDKVTAAAASLSSVVEKAEVDPQPHFAQYEKDVASVEAAVKTSEANLKSLQEECKAYFATWEKQAATIQDPDLKATAEKRKADLSKAVESVREKMDDVRAETGPFVITLKDMQTYLKNDLTPAGIKSVASKAKQVNKSAASISEKLDDVVEAIEKGAPAFKTAKPPPPEAEKKK